MISRSGLKHLQVPVIVFSLILVCSSMAPAQSPHQASTIQFAPPPPPTTGRPQGSGRGAGSRGPDCQRYENIIALVPLVQTSAQPIRWGLTTKAYPTLWFYAPQGLAANVPLELVVQEEDGKNRFRRIIQTSESLGGVFSLSLPPTAKPLQVGKTYNWSVAIYCDEAIDTPVTVQGSLKRVALSNKVENSLAATKNILELASLYAKEGIWFDALTTLGSGLRQGRDPEKVTAWRELLRQVNLDNITTDEIVPCCTIAQQAPSKGQQMLTPHH